MEMKYQPCHVGANADPEREEIREAKLSDICSLPAMLINQTYPKFAGMVKRFLRRVYQYVDQKMNLDSIVVAFGRKIILENTLDNFNNKSSDF